MLRRALMPGRMFTNRGVAATHVPAMRTQPQMNPALMQLQALLAAFSVGFHWFDGVEMSTLVGHTSRPFHISCSLHRCALQRYRFLVFSRCRDNLNDAGFVCASEDLSKRCMAGMLG